MYCLEVRIPRGSVLLSLRSLEDSGRWSGLDSNNSIPQAPTRPGHFCPGIFCQTFKILINLHSDLPDPKEDGWGSRWPFTCPSICPATEDPLKRQLGRDLLPEFWRLAHSLLYPFLSSLYTLVFLVPLPNHFSFTQRKSSLSYSRGEKKIDTLQISFSNDPYSLLGQGQCFLSLSLTLRVARRWTSLLPFQLNTLKSQQLWPW